MSDLLNSQVVDPFKKAIAPFHKTPVQRDAARLVAALGLGSTLFGGGAALALNARRANERKLLDEETAKAVLPVHIYNKPKEKKKEASAASIAAKAALPVIGVGGIAAGIAKANHDRSKIPADAPAKPTAGFLTRLINTLPGGKSLAKESQRITDLPGTIRGEYAENPLMVPWAIPAGVGLGMGGLLTGYMGVNAVGDALAKRRLKKKRDKAKLMLEDALTNEQQSKMGAALEEFVTTADEIVPQMKEAFLGGFSPTEGYLSLLGLGMVGGAGLGAYRGYSEASQKHRLSALKQIRNLQLAKRRREELTLVPDNEDSPSSDVTLPNASEDDSVKAAGLDRLLLAGLKQFPRMGRAGLNAIKTSPKPIMKGLRAAGGAMKSNPVSTGLIGGGVAAEGLGAVLDSNHSSFLGDRWWRPSNLVMDRFRERKPMIDADGNPIYGTHRTWNITPGETRQREWSSNPFAGMGNAKTWWPSDLLRNWEGFGYRFRKDNTPMHQVVQLKTTRPENLADGLSSEAAGTRRMNALLHEQLNKRGSVTELLDGLDRTATSTSAHN